MPQPVQTPPIAASHSPELKASLMLPGRTRPFVMAHRGNQVACPENTLAAFRRAIDEGADILETDLHLTADGTLVCIHDASVDRTTDGRGDVADLGLHEIKGLSAAYGRPEFVDERIPTLAELLDLIPADTGLALELKTDRFLEPAVCRQLVAQLQDGGIRDRTVVLSFSLIRLQAVQAVASDLPIGWITLSRLWPLQGVQMLGPLWPLLLANPLYVWLAHVRKQLVCPLDPTPNRRLGLYTRLGCDAVLSDDPGATIEALRGFRES
ncbi:MAG: glycerophosphodiester phosphodiesterase [Anaerolineae bacterium]